MDNTEMLLKVIYNEIILLKTMVLSIEARRIGLNPAVSDDEYKEFILGRIDELKNSVFYEMD